MANTKSALKAMRQSERRRLRNRATRSAVRTYYGKAQRSIASNDPDTLEQVRIAIRALDKAAQKGIIHPNNAARRKSRLMKKFNALASANA